MSVKGFFESHLPWPAPGGGRPSVFAALRERNYRLYWVGLIFYVLGVRFEAVTYAWLVWELTESPIYLGYLGLAQGVPVTLFQVIGGVIADRTQRLRLLIATQLGTGVVLTTAFLLTATGLIRVEHTLLLAVISGTFRAFDEPSRQALVPFLVDRKNLPNAVALGSMPWQSGRIIGPALAGVLLATFGSALGLGTAMLTNFAALALYSNIRVPREAPATGGQSMLRNLVDGIAFIGRTPMFAVLIGLTFFNSVFGMSYMTLLPIFADQYYDSGSGGYGLMQATSGLGAVLATLTMARVAHRIRRRGTLVVAGATCFGLLLMVFSQSPSLFPALAILVLVGFSSTLYLTVINILLQENVPDQLRGRVMGIYALCWNLIPIGGFVAGAVAAAVDARFAVLLGGALVAAGALWLLVFQRLIRAI